MRIRYFRSQWFTISMVYLFLFLSNMSFSQTTLTVRLHDQSEKTFHVSANGKVWSENSFLSVILDANSAAELIPLSTIRKLSFANLSATHETTPSSGSSVFPNPADQYIIFRDENKHLLEVKLFTILGQLVLSGQFLPGERIDVSDLTPGLYLAKVNQTTVKLMIE